MPTITPVKKQHVVVRREFTLSPYQQRELAKLLGIKQKGEKDIFAILLAHFADHSARLRGAPLAPQRANHITAFAKVQKEAARLYETIAVLPDHHRTLLPNVDAFTSQLAAFHDGVQTGLIQMCGRPSPHGGGKTQSVAGARLVVEHSLGVFFDLNARAPDGKCRNEGLTAPMFVQERQYFVEYCMDLIETPVV